MPRLAALAAAALIVAASSAGAGAQGAGDVAQFMQRFSGEWRGTGRVLVGPDHGAKFHCALAGEPTRGEASLLMTGKCWVGRISALVRAQLRYNPETDRFYGAFLEGADGNGVDLVGMRQGDGFVMSLTSGMAQGRLTAEPVGGDQLKVMIALIDRANDRDIPVVAMGFAKEGAVSLPHYYEPGATGSLARTP